MLIDLPRDPAKAGITTTLRGSVSPTIIPKSSPNANRQSLGKVTQNGILMLGISDCKGLMNLIPLIIVVALIGFIVYLISSYNAFQRLKTQITASIQEIGNQLKRQASLIPNLEASVKGYMKHESGIFEKLTDARKSVASADKSMNAESVEAAVNNLQSIIPALKVMVEDNPELKADTTVTRFMEELADTADKLSYARRTLIDLTQQYNEKRVTFPSNIIASMFGFGEEKGLATPATGAHVEVSDSETVDPKVKLN